MYECMNEYRNKHFFLLFLLVLLTCLTEPKHQMSTHSPQRLIIPTRPPLLPIPSSLFHIRSMVLSRWMLPPLAPLRYSARRGSF